MNGIVWVVTSEFYPGHHDYERGDQLPPPPLFRSVYRAMEHVEEEVADVGFEKGEVDYKWEQAWPRLGVPEGSWVFYNCQDEDYFVDTVYCVSPVTVDSRT